MDEPVKIKFTGIGIGPPLLLLHDIPTWSYLYQDEEGKKSLVRNAAA